VALVVDTSVALAALVPSDRHHDACAALLRDRGEPVVLPAVTLPELDYFCGVAERRDRFVEVLRSIRAGAVEIADVRPADYVRAEELLETYADLRVGFVDAGVLAIVERLGETKLATLDHRHFGAMRPRHVVSLELLPARPS